MSAPLSMPDSAGEWEWLDSDNAWYLRDENFALSSPYWENKWHRVTVAETPAAGRLCAALRMGGSAECGFAPWSGEWRKI